MLPVDMMSFKQKNTIITLINFLLILIYYVIRVCHMLITDSFTESQIFNLFGIVIFWAVIVTVIAIIIANFGLQIFHAIKHRDEAAEFDDFEDERDKLIDLRGTRVTYTLSSLGSLIAMLTFVFGQPPLVMFALLIMFGLIAQIVGDIARLLLYRKRI